MRGLAQSLWGAPPSANSEPRGSRIAIAAILAGAFALRLGIAAVLPSIHQADEVYQVAEQANRAVHGYGVISWEFRTASRTAILAELVVPIYRIAASPATHQLLEAALLSALSLLPIWVAWRWTRERYGGRAALLSSVLVATWFELLYFAPKATADVVGGYLLITAVFLARPWATGREVFFAGVLLALTFGVRLQITPAIAVVYLLAFLAGPRPHRSVITAGLLCGLAIVGSAEWIWWGEPFRGQWGYLLVEFKYHASAYFTPQPMTFFLKEYVLIYGGALPVMLLLIALGARRAPILLIASLAVILPFQFIAHKEYRFVVAAVPMLVMLMTLALSDLAGTLLSRRAAVVSLVAGWIVAMIGFGWSDHFRPYWWQSHNHIQAFRDIGRQPDACGIALSGVGWWQTPGYSGIGRDVPIYQLERGESGERLAAAANYLVAGPKLPAPPASFVLWKEYARPVERVYRRDGGCVPDRAAQVITPIGIPGMPE